MKDVDRSADGCWALAKEVGWLLLGLGRGIWFTGCCGEMCIRDSNQRAFMATYQDLGYYSDDVLTVLSPVRRIRQFDVR